MMVKGYTLPKRAEELQIHISTAFYWRHKILYAIRSLGHPTLKGIVQSEETYFLESEKGKKFIAHRKARKRGGVAKKRGISKEQICVVVAYDRNGQILSQMVGRGRVTAMEIDEVLGNMLTPLFCYAQIQQPTIKNFATMKGLQHEAIMFAKVSIRRKEFTIFNTSTGIILV